MIRRAFLALTAPVALPKRHPGTCLRRTVFKQASPATMRARKSMVKIGKTVSKPSNRMCRPSSPGRHSNTHSVCRGRVIITSDPTSTPST